MHKKTSWLTSDGGIYSASPDDALFRLVSSLYASGHPHMSSGDNCGLQGRSANLLRSGRARADERAYSLSPLPYFSTMGRRDDQNF